MSESVLTQADMVIRTLGPAKIPNGLHTRHGSHPSLNRYISDEEKVLVNTLTHPSIKVADPPPMFEIAGAREKIFFDPTKLKVAIVTCGGMCPGLNSLLRSIVLQLHFMYGVSNVVGIKYGLQGFIPSYNHHLVELNPEVVSGIQGRGGAFLGMSRGSQPVDEVVDSLERLNIGLLFMIGGDGTLHAASQIVQEITDRKLKLSVVCVPKTIDNDINFVDPSFGFQTAVEEATYAIWGAHNEAKGAPGGIGLLKLMGRHSGFVAAHATLAMPEVNFCLIPEVDFDLDGPVGLLSRLSERIAQRGHAVIVAAEGAGQKFFGKDLGADASGNKRLGDIGVYLKDRINEHFTKLGMEINLKYIDPSYLIRSMPSNSGDRIYTTMLGHYAVHAGMAGKTGMLVTKWLNKFVHVPLHLAIAQRRQVKPTSTIWQAVREATGQPNLLNY
ncbi:MAG: ATP-dependent 6-phosphofructokinase [Desulfarculales bacterium]|jgi:6-phosphofructokinase 1|nr:ATP-dependent 6-phosphofructokinase [Desulfarculales bacterium]